MPTTPHVPPATALPTTVPPATARYRMDPYDPFGDFGQEPVNALTSDWTAALLGSSLKHWTLDDLHRYLAPLGGINAQDPHGYTVLMGLALQTNDPTARGEEPWVDRLLRVGAAVNHRGLDGHSALSLALQHHQGRLAERLLAAGADPTLAGIQGVPYWNDNTVVANGPPGVGSTVHLALGHPDLLRKLLAAGADSNAPGSRESPLKQALIRGQSAAVLQLLEHGAALPTDPASPPLMLGLPNLLAYAVRALVRAGADPMARDAAGDAPIDAVMASRPFDDHGRLQRRRLVLALLDVGVPATVVLRGQAAVTTLTPQGAALGLGLAPEVPAMPLMHRVLSEAPRRIDWALVHRLAQHHGVDLDEAVPAWMDPMDGIGPSPRTLWERVQALAETVPQGSLEQQQAYRALIEWRALRTALDQESAVPSAPRPRHRL